MVKITSSNPRKIAYLKSVSYVPEDGIWENQKFVGCFNVI